MHKVDLNSQLYTFRESLYEPMEQVAVNSVSTLTTDVLLVADVEVGEGI